jgi:hypothetical protein
MEYMKTWCCKACNLSFSTVAELTRHLSENFSCLEKKILSEEVPRKGKTTVTHWSLEGHDEDGDDCVDLEVLDSSYINFVDCTQTEAINKFWPLFRAFCSTLLGDDSSLDDLNFVKQELVDVLSNMPQIEAALRNDNSSDLHSLESIVESDGLKFKTKKEGLLNAIGMVEFSIENITNMEKEISLCKRALLTILSRKQIERKVVADLESIQQDRLHVISLIKSFKHENGVTDNDLRTTLTTRDSLFEKHRDLHRDLGLFPPHQEEMDSWVTLDSDMKPMAKRKRQDREESLPPGLVGVTKKDRKRISDKMLEKIYGFILKPAPLTNRLTVPVTNLNTLHSFEKSLETLNIFPSSYSIMRGRKAALVNQFEFLSGYEKANFRFRASLQIDKKQKVEVLPLLVPINPCEYPSQCLRARDLKEALKISDDTLAAIVHAWRKAVANFDILLEAKFSQNSQQLTWVKSRNNAIRGVAQPSDEGPLV